MKKLLFALLFPVMVFGANNFFFPTTAQVSSRVTAVSNSLALQTNVAGMLYSGTINVPRISVNNMTGTIVVSNNSYQVYANSTFNGVIKRYDILTNTIFICETNSLNYIVFDYNNGNPRLKCIQDVDLITESDVIPVVTTFVASGHLDALIWAGLGKGLPNRLNQRFVKTEQYGRESGLIISQSTNRTFKISEGRVWMGGIRLNREAYDSATNELFLYYHTNASTFVHHEVKHFDYSYWDTGSNRQALSAGKYTVKWVYRCIGEDDDAYILLGDGDYSLADAQSAQPPSSTPSRIQAMGMLVGKIIASNGSKVGEEYVQTVFVVTASGTGTLLHNNLGNLDFASSGHTGFARQLQITTLSNRIAAVSNAGNVNLAVGTNALHILNTTEGTNRNHKTQTLATNMGIRLTNSLHIVVTTEGTNRNHKTQMIATNLVTASTLAFHIVVTKEGTNRNHKTQTMATNLSQLVTNGIKLHINSASNSAYAGAVSRASSLISISNQKFTNVKFWISTTNQATLDTTRGWISTTNQANLNTTRAYISATNTANLASTKNLISVSNQRFTNVKFWISTTNQANLATTKNLISVSNQKFTNVKFWISTTNIATKTYLSNMIPVVVATATNAYHGNGIGSFFVTGYTNWGTAITSSGYLTNGTALYQSYSDTNSFAYVRAGTNSGFTIKSAGTYRISYNLTHVSGANNQSVLCSIRKNGAEFPLSRSITGGTSSNGVTFNVNGFMEMTCIANDTVKVNFLNANSSAIKMFKISIVRLK